jgi:phenylpropionate dioxygenase-like ring-hydroxylating dioxygenase large terminal subunit
MEGFDKGSNNLLPVHVHIDAKGFIWVNLDASETPEIAWTDDFAGMDQLPRHEPFDFDDYTYDHSWDMSGDYNWKTLADNYNECYHCATSHPDVSSVADLSAYTVQNKGGNIQHFPGTTPDQEKAGLTVVSNYYFPNACMSVT